LPPTHALLNTFIFRETNVIADLSCNHQDVHFAGHRHSSTRGTFSPATTNTRRSHQSACSLDSRDRSVA
jgi:hypothetical protein